MTAQKNGWIKSKLGNITTKIGSGATPLGGEKAYKDTGISLIRSLNVYDDGFRETGLAQIDEEQASRLANVIVQPNDVLLNITGASVARCCLVPSTVLPARVNQHVSIVRPNEKNLDATFLRYMLISKQYKDRLLHVGEEGGATRQAITKAQIENFVVEFPESLLEQKRIVGILDEAFDGIATAKANAEKNLQNARELFESELNAVFDRRGDGWDKKVLQELCEIKHGFPFQSKYFVEHGDNILLTPGNFYESGGYRDRGDKQKYYQGDIPEEFVLNDGDLLVAMTEQAAGLLGSPILVPGDGKFLHNQRLGLVTRKPGVPWTNEFFFHVFNTRRVRSEIHDGASGVKVRHTSPKKLGVVEVSYPTSIVEQRRIASVLNKISDQTKDLKSIYQRKLAALDELKKSLLHQAFSGQL